MTHLLSSVIGIRASHVSQTDGRILALLSRQIIWRNLRRSLTIEMYSQYVTFITTSARVVPYPGAKEMLLLEPTENMTQMIRAMYAELPEPKKKT